MVIWAALVGAFIGWLWADFEGYGVVLGGVFGAVAGIGMRRAVRAEIERAVAELRAAAPSPSPYPDVAAFDRPASSPTFAARPQSVELPLVEAADAAEADTVAPYRDVELPQPPEPAFGSAVPFEPGPMERSIAAAREWLFGGNTVVRLGLVILFVGLSFLVRYAAAAGLFPIELRLAAVVMAGIALLGVGFRTRVAQPGFGLALQGAGVAIVYLTLFAAVKLVPDLPVTAAFAVMILVCAFGCGLALFQSSQALALTAFAGGYATPLLLSDGSGQVAGLFAYYTILNLAVLFIASRQAWRLLNPLGFFASFGVASLWMAQGYQPADFQVTQAFVVASVLIYLTAAVFFARRTPGRTGAVIDTTLLFGPAVAGFGLQVALVGDRPFGSAFAAVGFAALYLGVATLATRRDADRFRVLHEGMLAIGIGFVTLAVPLALGARWTSAAWALEGAGASWVGMRQARWTPRMFGLLLQLVAALIFLAGAHTNIAPLPLANASFMGAMLIAAALLATAWWLRTPIAAGGSWLALRYAAIEASLGSSVFLAGFFFWWFGWALEAARALPPVTTRDLPVAALGPGLVLLLPMLVFVLSAWVSRTIGRRTGWAVAAWPSLATLPALALAFAATIAAGRHVLSAPDWLLWSVAVAVHLRVLRAIDRDEDDHARAGPLVGAIHVGGVWLATAMLGDSLWLGIERAALWRTSWAGVMFLVSVTLVLIALALGSARALALGANRWPLARHAIAYGWVAPIPMAALVYIGAMLTAALASGETAPLPYLPLLNPVDLSLALAIGSLLLWRRVVLAAVPRPAGAARLAGTEFAAAMGWLGFVALNTVWLRFAHRWLGLPWTVDALLGDFVVQTGFAILWTLIALVLMVAAHRTTRREPWLIGAGLLGLTIVKLMLIDLNNSASGARIVTFIAVGALMLVLGYVAPLPPKRPAEVRP